MNDCFICGHIFTEKHRVWPGQFGGEYDDHNVIRLCQNHHAMAHCYMSISRKLNSKKKITDEELRRWKFMLDDSAFYLFATSHIDPITKRVTPFHPVHTEMYAHEMVAIAESYQFFSNGTANGDAYESVN